MRASKYLLLDAICRADHKNDHVGALGSSEAHVCKRLVARSVYEGDSLAVLAYLMECPDFLSDSWVTGFNAVELKLQALERRLLGDPRFSVGVSETPLLRPCADPREPAAAKTHKLRRSEELDGRIRAERKLWTSHCCGEPRALPMKKQRECLRFKRAEKQGVPTTEFGRHDI